MVATPSGMIDMSMNEKAQDERVLLLQRTLVAPRAKVWQCWTDGDLLKQWYCPKPWQVIHAELDVRAGGRNFVIMQGPEGQQVPVAGVYLEVVSGHKLVITDAFERAWEPSDRAFMVAEISLGDTAEGHTRYLARVRHWSTEDRDEHEKMGFHEGWGIAADQLEALARGL